MSGQSIVCRGCMKGCRRRNDGEVGGGEVGRAAGTRFEAASRVRSSFQVWGKPLKDFMQENDMIIFMSCENRSSFFVEKTA